MPASLRVMTYNIRHGQGLDDLVSLERVAMNIVAAGADLCGIQELDKYLPRSGWQHQAKKIAKLCGMHYVFANNISYPLLAAYGNAILSRWPITASNHYPLPGTGESRGLLKAVITRGQEQIDFFTTHLGLKPAERVDQVLAINQIINQCQSPVILTGDFNEGVDGEAVGLILDNNLQHCLPADKNLLPTFPATNPQTQIDFIFAGQPWQVEDVWAIDSGASDHRPLVAILDGEKTLDY